MKKIILASGSPRRHDLLKQIGVPFEVIVSDAEEIYQSEEPAEIVRELAFLKAAAVAGMLKENGRGNEIILGADTVVACDGRILGKPRDEAEACKMVETIQGRSHQVYTGVAILECENGAVRAKHTHVEETKVFVHAMTAEEIRDYVATGEPMDKAGAYGVQGCFAAYIDRIEGDFYNVVGLPVAYVYQKLKEINN